MNNITLQLFEYLLAAGNSNLCVNYNLNKYPAYWFLDEILSWKNVQLESMEEGKTCIKLYKSSINDRNIEISLLLSTVLNLMQYNHIGNSQALISKDELEKNLLLEVEAIKRKIEDESQDAIIINDWQQLLLGVDRTQIPMKVAIERRERLEFFTEQILKEYQEWKNDIKYQNMEQEQTLKVQELYDYFLNLSTEMNLTNKINLGIGVLHIPGEPAVYHPLLTLGIKVVIDQSKEICELVFEEQLLTIDAILDQVLFYDLDFARQMRLDTSKMEVSPFDDNLIAAILQKIVNHIHPDGRYFASPVDAALAPEDVPLVLHRSVLFIKEEQSCNRTNKLKLITEHLSNNYAPSDVIGSIGDPNYTSLNNHASKYGITESNAPFFVWSTDGMEERILDLLDQHHAVAVFEDEKGDKSFIVANLITHLMTIGKRVLVVGEDDSELDKIQEAIPSYLSGLHSKLSTKEIDYQKLKNDLLQLLDKNEYYRHLNLATDKINDEIEQTKAQLNEITGRIVDYRELGSKKIFWKDRRYYPYELAQLISKLGGKDYLDGDVLPLDMRFDMKDSEIGKIWELRAYFTPENMSLLNYDFIDINELTSYHEYQKMLASEEKFLKLSKEAPNFDEMFDKTTDIRFVQYLFDQLPKLMKDVSEVKTAYGEKILRKALISLESHHTLASVLDRINCSIEDTRLANGNAEERGELIKKLNQMFDIGLSELSTLNNHDQNQLIEFYTEKRTEMMSALYAAHSILIFNEGAKALSSDFKGILASSIDLMNILYYAAALHLSKVEFEICWFRVKSHFLREYLPLIQQEHIHPVCIDLYEALKNDHIKEFREVLEEIETLIETRQNFVVFGNFIDQMGDMIPIFTTSTMSDENFDTTIVPDFKEAIDKAKLNGLFGQLQTYESEFLDQGIEYYKEYLLKLQHETLEKESWRNRHYVNQSVLLEIVDFLEEEGSLNDKVINALLSTFGVLFMPLNENLENLDPKLFDLVIFVDASRSNIMRITELMHAHKAVLFGNENDEVVTPLMPKREDFQKISNRYGKILQSFGEQYLEDSLFNLVANSAAWDAHVKLPKQATHVPIGSIGEHIKSGAKMCETPTEDEIFEALVKIGYDVKCKVKVGKIMLDFLVIGEADALAINVIGDAYLQREVIKGQIEQEMELRSKGLNIRTVQAAHFYLNSRKTLMDLCACLEELEIYPLKK